MSEIENPQKKSNGAFVAIIIILLLGLAAMAYLWSSKNSDLNQCKSDNALLNSDMDGMNDMMSGYVGGMTNDIKTDFKEMLKTYDLLLEKDKSKADSINKQKAEIAELLEKVERGNMSARQLFSARKEIETMKKIKFTKKEYSKRHHSGYLGKKSKEESKYPPGSLLNELPPSDYQLDN